MCQLASVSRASYYRHWLEVVPDEAEMAIRAAIQKVVLAHRRRYGYRRVTVDLHRQGMRINHKHVLRLMREDNLLAIRYRQYVLTSDSRHECEVYLNLAARMTLTGINQLWVADITISVCGLSSCSWRWSSIGSRGKQWAGRWIAHSRRGWRSPRYGRPSLNGSHHRVLSITPTKGSNTPAPIT